MTLNPAIRFPFKVGVLLSAALLAAALLLTLREAAITLTDDGAAAFPPALAVDGNVEVTSADNVVTRLVVPLAVRGDDGILLTEGGRLHATTVMSESASAAVPATYTVTWTEGNGDEILDPGEHAVLTVDLATPSSVHPGQPIDIIVRPVEGTALTVKVVE